MRELNRAEQELTPAVLARFKGTININGKPVTIPTLQRILKADELLLEYVVDEPESVCLAITNKTIRPYLLPARSALEKLVNAYLTETKDTAATAPSSHIAASP